MRFMPAGKDAVPHEQITADSMQGKAHGRRKKGMELENIQKIQERKRSPGGRNARESCRKRSSRRKAWAWKQTCLKLLAGILCLALAGIYAVRTTRERIPDSLLELKEKYPQTAEFVDSYPRKKNREISMDVSGEVTPGEIPLFIQWDERWGYHSYGNNFFGVNGCGPTCLSMVVCGLTGDTYWNPYEVGVFSEQSGYYVPGEGTAWDLMTEGADVLGLGSEQGEVSEDYIRECMEAGLPLICSMYPGDFTYTGHFIVLTGLDEGGTVIVHDPNSPENSEKHWPMEALLPQICAVWSFWALQ